MHQVKQVSKVCAKVIHRTVVLFLIPNPLFPKPHLPQLHCHLSNRFGNTGYCRAVGAGIEARRVVQMYLVEVLEEEQVGLGRRQIRDHERGICVGAGPHDRGAQPVDNRTEGSLGCSVDNRSSKAFPGLYWGEIVTQQ